MPTAKELPRSRRLSLLLPKNFPAKVFLSREAGVTQKIPRVLERLFAKILMIFSEPPQNVEVHLLKSDSMRQLNKRFRQKNKTTDVLSFVSREPQLLGSIVIDVEVAKIQAKQYQHSVDREITDLFVHGVLHLLGLDHQNKKDAEQMKQYEKFFGGILDQIGGRDIC
jgi:probable rRNA maturation factor